MGIAINTEITNRVAIAESAWFKSSYSNDSGGNCVEIADLPDQIGIRDSKDPTGPVLLLTPKAFSSFINTTKLTPVDRR
ncbi:DUF397 domain-containing protein [Streptomyces sp. NPDC058953]|uniref:DUF397 domain-containing protein n=1 Tax=unclassified Streptomyces TaxID=2593676 RepID=UPI00369EB1EE